MAIVIGIDTDIIKQVDKDTVNRSGSLFIDRAYLTNETQEIETISELSEYTKVTANTLKIGVGKITSVMQQSLDDTITYQKIYLCNSNDDILMKISIESITTNEVNDTIVLDLAEINQII